MRNHPQPGLITLAVLATLATLTTAPALAQDAGATYYGLSVGPSRGKLDESRITTNLTGQVATDISTDDRTTAFRLFGGYQLSPNLALEAGYYNLGKFGFTSTVPAGTLNGQVKFQGISLDLLGSMPIGSGWSALGRVGAAYTKARDSFEGSAVTASSYPSQSKTDLKYGLGLQYAFNPSVLMRGEAERYRANDGAGNSAHVNVVSLSLVFPFGGNAGQTRHSAYSAPAPVVAQAPPPAPAPVAVAVATPVPAPAPAPMVPERQRVSLSADSLFSFDNAALTPEGKAALDTFARNLQGASFDTITVQGHTDRLGTADYNQKLSEQRAQAVKAYLSEAGGLQADKIVTSGRSESEPVTQPGDCKGNAPTAKLISCLQPDRRVDVEVTGTR